MSKIIKVEDLSVYQKLCFLALEIHELTMTFPKFELYELGSQLRRSSNSAAANLAEGFSNKHVKIYLKGISISLGEIRETRHHLKMSCHKKYLDKEKLQDFISRYDECGKMLKGLEKSLLKFT